MLFRKDDRLCVWAELCVRACTMFPGPGSQPRAQAGQREHMDTGRDVSKRRRQQAGGIGRRCKSTCGEGGTQGKKAGWVGRRRMKTQGGTAYK